LPEHLGTFLSVLNSEDSGALPVQGEKRPPQKTATIGVLLKRNVRFVSQRREKRALIEEGLLHPQKRNRPPFSVRRSSLFGCRPRSREKGVVTYLFKRGKRKKKSAFYSWGEPPTGDVQRG